MICKEVYLYFFLLELRNPLDVKNKKILSVEILCRFDLTQHLEQCQVERRSYV